MFLGWLEVLSRAARARHYDSYRRYLLKAATQLGWVFPTKDGRVCLTPKGVEYINIVSEVYIKRGDRYAKYLHRVLTEALYLACDVKTRTELEKLISRVKDVDHGESATDPNSQHIDQRH